MKKDIVIFDIDGVLAHVDWRVPFIKESWDKYYEAGRNDHPITEFVTLANALAICGLVLVGVTGHVERFRSARVKWLFEHGIKLHDVLFRPDNDFSPAPEMKRKLIERIKDRILFAVDDDEKVCEMFRAEGISVLQAFAKKEERE